MALNLYVKTGNAAFEDDDKGLELARILEVAATKIRSNLDGPLRDINGNTVGFLFMGDFPDPPPPEAFVLSFETDNDAFAGRRLKGECARILDQCAENCRGGDFDFKIRDVNGNTVGRASELPAAKQPPQPPAGRPRGVPSDDGPRGP